MTIPRPFSPRQLIAEVAALLRRMEEDGAPLTDIFLFNDDDLIIDYLV